MVDSARGVAPIFKSIIAHRTRGHCQSPDTLPSGAWRWRTNRNEPGHRPITLLVIGTT